MNNALRGEEPGKDRGEEIRKEKKGRGRRKIAKVGIDNEGWGGEKWEGMSC